MYRSLAETERHAAGHCPRRDGGVGPPRRYKGEAPLGIQVSIAGDGPRRGENCLTWPVTTDNVALDWMLRFFQPCVSPTFFAEC